MTTKTKTRKLTDLVPTDHQADEWLDHYGQVTRDLERQAAELHELAESARRHREQAGPDAETATWMAGLAGHLLRLADAARRAHDALVA